MEKTAKLCPITGLNRLRYVMTTIAGFVTLMALDWLIHGVWLTETYMQTPTLWRSEEQMQNYWQWMWAFEFALAGITAFIFTRNYEGRGIWEGVRFGWMLGALWAVWMAMPWVWMPISAALAIKWALSGLVTGLALGLVFALVYRKD